jgi:hypothetical protein
LVHNPWHLPAASCTTPSGSETTFDSDDDDDLTEGEYDENDYVDALPDDGAYLMHDELPDPVVTPIVRHRRIVEFCTSSDSRIGRAAPPNCEVIRLTIDDDLTSTEGLNKAIAAVSDPYAQVLLFGSLPCTGGSQWQNLNWGRGPATQDKIRGHWEIFGMLFANFVKVAAACTANGGRIAIEWPRACSYWSLPVVQDFIRLHALTNYDFDGCMFGLCSATDGNPIKKPWRIASDMSEFTDLRRRCTHSPAEHALCAGTDTKASEGYTDALALLIHRCFASHACSSSPGGSRLSTTTTRSTFRLAVHCKM